MDSTLNQLVLPKTSSRNSTGYTWQSRIQVCVSSPAYQLVKVPVNYNTGNGVDQGGAMVLLPETCPDYAIRKAPF